MRPSLAYFALLALVPLAACSTLSTPVATIDPLSGNWQIENVYTPAIGVPAVYLKGPLLFQGSQVTGAFNTTGYCAGQIAQYNGTYDASSRTLTLQSASTNTLEEINLNLTIPSNPQTEANGSSESYTPLCGPATNTLSLMGFQVPPVTGIHTGPMALAPSSALIETSSTAPTSGNLTLTLSQSPTANANALFPLTGTLQFTGNTATANTSCTTAVPITGTIAGTSLSLASASSPAISITAANPLGGKTLTTYLTFAADPCTGAPSSAVYSGTLNLQ